MPTPETMKKKTIKFLHSSFYFILASRHAEFIILRRERMTSGIVYVDQIKYFTVWTQRRRERMRRSEGIGEEG